MLPLKRTLPPSAEKSDLLLKTYETMLYEFLKIIQVLTQTLRKKSRNGI